MKKDSALVEHLLEILALLGDVSARSMFGGWGIYHDGLMMGLVAGGRSLPGRQSGKTAADGRAEARRRRVDS